MRAGATASPRWRVAAVVGLALLSAPLQGCGFRPLYGAAPDGQTSMVVAELGSIQIPAVSDRVGQIVRNDLLDAITPFGQPREPRYVLDVRVDESKEGLAIARDATVTRFNLTLSAEYSLRDAGTAKVIASGVVRAVAAYNVLQSDFANVIAERDAEVRAARVITDQIKTRLSVHFAAAGPAQDPPPPQ